MSPPPYEQRAAGPKGQGTFSKDNITRGTRILAERPLLTVPQDAEHDLEARGDAIVEAFDGLGPTQQKRFRQLHNAFSNSKDDVVGIFNTNAFSGHWEMAADERLGVVGFTASRFNHGCRPNAR
jgi:hypothetical protein